MKNKKESGFTQNEFFDPKENATYELFNLLLHLPEDFRTKELTQEQSKLIAAALLHACSVKHDVIEGIDAIGDLLCQAQTDIELNEETASQLSRGSLSRVGRLLRHMAAIIFFLWQTEEALSSAIQSQPQRIV